MNPSDQILDGIRQGVDRHWRYTKNLLRVKPEYLLTVSVADALSDGFGGICGLDLEIKLEEPTYKISSNLLINKVGFKDYFKQLRHKVSRRGKVDIYIECDSSSWIVELKGFNPSTLELQKDIDRLAEFSKAYGGNHNCVGCYLAFPTTLDITQSWSKNFRIGKASEKFLSIKHDSIHIETNEDPEDGIPSYYANCISITNTNIQP